MSPALSTYLDLLRLLAAAVVFLTHFGTQRISGGLFYQIGHYGGAAVDMFFVISGFVIAHAIATREADGRTYAMHRVARIYSVVLPALALGVLLDSAGSALNPAVYQGAPGFTDPAGPLALLSSALFLDQIWWRAAQPGSNLPFWSISLEAWFYLAFGLLVFLRRPWNLLAAAFALLCAGPKIAQMFPLWLIGVACYHLSVRTRPSAAIGWLLLLGPILALAVWPDPLTLRCVPYQAYNPAPICLAYLSQDYGFVLLVACHLLGVHTLSDRVAAILAPIARPVRWLAGASFTLYLLHYPLIHFLVAASPWPATHWITRALVLGLAPVLILAVASLTERRKQAWRNAVARLLLPRPAAP